MKHSASRLALFTIILLPLASLLSGCNPQPVTTLQISRVQANVVDLMKEIMVLSQNASDTAEAAFRDLSAYINSNNLSLQQLTSLEEYRATAKAQATQMRETLNSLQEQAEKLFSLLKRRTEENQTPHLREKMFALIQDSEGRFKDVLQVAIAEVNLIDMNAQGYDDAVGYAQVSRGLAGIAPIRTKVVQLTMSAKELNQELQRKMSEGIYIAEWIQRFQREEGTLP